MVVSSYKIPGDWSKFPSHDASLEEWIKAVPSGGSHHYHGGEMKEAGSQDRLWAACWYQQVPLSRKYSKRRWGTAQPFQL